MNFIRTLLALSGGSCSITEDICDGEKREEDENITSSGLSPQDGLYYFLVLSSIPVHFGVKSRHNQ